MNWSTWPCETGLTSCPARDSDKDKYKRCDITVWMHNMLVFLYCDICTAAPFFILCDFHVAWFMVGLYLSHSGALDGARPPVRAGSAPEPRPEERIKRTSSSGPATDCEIQVNPGRYCNALHCRYVVMRSQSLLSESFPGHHCLPACLQAPLWGTGDRGGYVTASHDWHKGDMYCPLVILTVWRRLKVQISVLISLMKDLSFN